MNWVGILLLAIHVVTCSALILIVLLQAGKGASLGAAFGGGSSQTMFGAQGASFISRFTWVLFAVFVITSVLLTMVSPWGKSMVETESAVLSQEPIAEPPLGETALPATPAPGMPVDSLPGLTPVEPAAAPTPEMQGEAQPVPDAPQPETHTSAPEPVAPQPSGADLPE